jgi:hypothetical protein
MKRKIHYEIHFKDNASAVLKTINQNLRSANSLLAENKRLISSFVKKTIELSELGTKARKRITFHRKKGAASAVKFHVGS